MVIDLENKDLIAAVRLILHVAHGRAFGVIAENNPSLYKIRNTKEQQDKIDALFVVAAGDAVEAIKDAGYALPQKGDLRAQLLQLGRSLKSYSYSAGYSGDGGIEEKISEAKAEVKSDIGHMILDALDY